MNVLNWTENWKYEDLELELERPYYMAKHKDLMKYILNSLKKEVKK